MRKNSSIKVTRFSSLVTTKSYTTITMFEELNHIKNGTYKNIVLKCRQALQNDDREEYKKLKSELPAVTFCGEFNGRKVNDIIQYNNLMILDIDDLSKEDFFKIKRTLSEDKYILSLWDSPSGIGLKCLIKTNNQIEQHKAVFNSLSAYFLENYQIVIDKSGKDISRLCFSSWDENIHYNPKADIYTDFLELESEKSSNAKAVKSVSLARSAYATEGLNKKEDRNLMKKIIDFLSKQNQSITGDFDSWVKVALGISYSFSYDVGERYFLALCRLDQDNHHEEKSIALLQNCYNNRKVNSNEIITFATVIFLAKEKGFILKKFSRK